MHFRKSKLSAMNWCRHMPVLQYTVMYTIYNWDIFDETNPSNFGVHSIIVCTECPLSLYISSIRTNCKHHHHPQCTRYGPTTESLSRPPPHAVHLACGPLCHQTQQSSLVISPPHQRPGRINRLRSMPNEEDHPSWSHFISMAKQYHVEWMARTLVVL